MVDTDRRALIAGAIVLASGAATAPLRAQTMPGDETLLLWPGMPPGGPAAVPARKIEEHSKDPAHPDRWVTGIERPMLIVKRPANPNGAGVLILPGGGYGFLAFDNEGTEQARWLNAAGFTAFILLYRLPTEGWRRRADVPLQDAQRALRLIRAGAPRFGVNPDRIAALGFSAGGHLAGCLATRHGEQVYAPVDSADAGSARPDLAALIYPVVSLSAPFVHGASRDQLLGTDADAVTRARYSVEQRVDAATPPMFIVHAADDPLVPVENSIALAAAMRAAKRPAEMHIFDEGAHGFGVRLPRNVPTSQWPQLLLAYGRRKKVFPEA